MPADSRPTCSFFPNGSVLALLIALSLARVAAAQEVFVQPAGTLSLIEEVPTGIANPTDPFRPEAFNVDTSQQVTTQPIAESPGFASSPIVVGLPTALSTGNGLVVRPEVQLGPPIVVGSAEMDVRWLQMQRPSAELSSPQILTALQESVPPPPTADPAAPLPAAEPLPIQNIEPLFQELVQTAPVARARHPRWHILWNRWWDPCPGTGLGQERLAYALFDLDTAQPFNNFRVRTQVARRMHLPDRAEYFWQRTVDRRGPALGESLMDYQQLNMRMETGSKKLSTAFEVPLRATNPELNANHAGLGDMNLAVKTVLLDGEQWLFAQQFTTYFPTGSPTMGLGRGKIALEPGILVRNRWNDRTWIHGQLKFWFPLGADPQHGGQVLNVATGFNRVLWETDTRALIPSLEFSTYTVLNGLARDNSQLLRRVDGDSMLYITPGMHYSMDRKGDLGLFELGTGVSLATTNQRFADSTWMFDVRWSW